MIVSPLLRVLILVPLVACVGRARFGHRIGPIDRVRFPEEPSLVSLVQQRQARADGLLTAPSNSKEQDRRRLLTANDRIKFLVNRLAFLVLNNIDDQAVGLGNIIYSPVELSKVLSQLLLGAGGRSQKELNNLLSFSDLGFENELAGHRSLAALLRELVGNSTELKLANALLLSNSFQLKEEFENRLDELYSPIAVNLINFQKHADLALQWANSWVAESTNGLIPELLSQTPSADTQLILLSAINFKAPFRTPFNPRLTRTGNFFNEGRDYDQVEVPFMRQKLMTPYAEVAELDCKALLLDYESAGGQQIDLLLLLPRDNMGLAKLQKQLTAATIQSVSRQLKETAVEVELPKFDLKYQLDIKGLMTKLNSFSLFEPRFANLSRLAYNHEGLTVTDAYQIARVRMYEEGTEAGAGTAIITESRTLAHNRAEQFIADHPFLFLIRINDVAAFIGRIAQL